jgi:hypothetical protein
MLVACHGMSRQISFTNLEYQFIPLLICKSTSFGFTLYFSLVLKGSLVHVAPTCAGFGEGSDHFVSYIRSLSLHFCKRLFPGLEPMTSHIEINNLLNNLSPR